ncbi:Rad60/SUMO-like domain-containing protein [Hirschfeldia incana]|nr:Rad60/SUMO-like domain-containing protein [Hirschfeldia incana]
MSNPHEEDKNYGDQETQIILKDDEVFFKIKKSTKLKILMYAYCDRRGLKLDAFAFLFDGKRICCNETPDELDMKDGDNIDALRSLGGGLRHNQRQWSYMVSIRSYDTSKFHD